MHNLLLRITNEFSGNIGILFRSIEGELLKLLYVLGCIKCRHLGVKEYPRDEKVIISLTSYGRRVGKSLPLTIVSLLRQTYKPDKVILWLDNGWVNKKLPPKLTKLEKYGLTIRFCEDIKSYKKLIPSLREFPNDIIITVDDDAYYRKNVVEKLIKCHHDNPGKIICNDAHFPCISEKGEFLSYNLWKYDVYGIDNLLVFPVGLGGCLYKKKYLYKDVCEEGLFMQLAPKADDVWLYFMAILNGTGHIVLPYKENVLIPLDNFYQILHKSSNLSNTNYRESFNDVQIQAVVRHYGINSEILNSQV